MHRGKHDIKVKSVSKARFMITFAQVKKKGNRLIDSGRTMATHLDGSVDDPEKVVQHVGEEQVGVDRVT